MSILHVQRLLPQFGKSVSSLIRSTGIVHGVPLAAMSARQLGGAGGQNTCRQGRRNGYGPWNREHDGTGKLWPGSATDCRCPGSAGGSECSEVVSSSRISVAHGGGHRRYARQWRSVSGDRRGGSASYAKHMSCSTGSVPDRHSNKNASLGGMYTCRDGLCASAIRCGCVEKKCECGGGVAALRGASGVSIRQEVNVTTGGNQIMSRRNAGELSVHGGKQSGQEWTDRGFVRGCVEWTPAKEAAQDAWCKEFTKVAGCPSKWIGCGPYYRYCGACTEEEMKRYPYLKTFCLESAIRFGKSCEWNRSGKEDAWRACVDKCLDDHATDECLVQAVAACAWARALGTAGFAACFVPAALGCGTATVFLLIRCLMRCDWEYR